MWFYGTDGRAYGGAAAGRFSMAGARNQARGRDSLATCGSTLGPNPRGLMTTSTHADSGRARERPQRKRSSAFEGARPRRLPHDAAVTVPHGVRSTGTETRDRLPFAPQRGSGPTYPRACAVSAEPFCHFCLPNRRCNTRSICSSKYSSFFHKRVCMDCTDHYLCILQESILKIFNFPFSAKIP